MLELKDRFPAQLQWLCHQLERLSQTGGAMVERQTIKIGLDLSEGGNYAACIVHGPLLNSDQPMVPTPYLKLLQRFNGAKFHAVDLYGILEDASNNRRCLSLQTANEFWINGFRRLPPKSFLFGGRTFSWQENLGYFYDSTMRVFQQGNLEKSSVRGLPLKKC
jgi:hypothetical protein